MLDVQTAILFLSAFVLAGVMQTLWLRSKLFQRFAWPLDGNITVRGRRIFGENKTVAGFFGMVVFAAGTYTVIGIIAQHIEVPFQFKSILPETTKQWAATGTWSGFCYMLFELPNSFVKRQFDIPPGHIPNNRLGRFLVLVVDEVDSVLGATIATALIFPLGLKFIGFSLIGGMIIHRLFNFLLVWTGIKRSPAL
jgi:hypothetical protein